ncbi:hypothetical protein FM107_15305 [Sphingobacterium sp. JB170]|nr:hypothetical protein FM107_15305 [Sphingobacterium sp. JB170]
MSGKINWQYFANIEIGQGCKTVYYTGNDLAYFSRTLSG